MKLAEALQERADLNRRIEQLGYRMMNNATYQEGTETAEDPGDLIREFDACTKRLEELMTKINLTNASTEADGKTITELIARRDVLTVRIEKYRNLISAASQTAHRATRTEIRVLSAVDVKKLQKEVDAMAKEHREVDNRIQELNWTTEVKE